MDFNVKKIIKNSIFLISPFLIFLILFVPYNWVNQQFIVDWLGCGCPKTDEAGNILHSYFNANDFTVCFWFFISAFVTVISAFLSRRILNRRVEKVLYVVCVFVISLFISYVFIQLMMWN